MYDAVAESVPLATQGQHRKKAILLISDGNDTNSHTSVREVKQMVRETEVLVYAVGIDGNAETSFGGGRSTPPVVRQPPVRTPFPFPGGSGRGSPWPGGGIPGGGGGRGGGRVYGAGNDDRVNAAALREITDDSGGRTEIVRTARDLDPATENIADELSKQVPPRLSGARPQGRPLAHDPGRGESTGLHRAGTPRLHGDEVGVGDTRRTSLAVWPRGHTGCGCATTIGTQVARAPAGFLAPLKRIERRVSCKCGVG